MKALYAGSFDPFTIGHLDIAERALKICDTLIIAIGFNEKKREEEPVELRLNRIKSVFSQNPKVEVASYKGLTVDFARECGADILVRGVRNGTEFEKEKELADINKSLSGIDTIILPSDPCLSYISSSMVRELKHNGKDVSIYLPEGGK